MLNILISCVGKRSDLVMSFTEELQRAGNVITVDADKDAPGVKLANKSYIVPPFNSGDYIGVLFEICKNEKIRFIISLNVSDLIILTKNKSKFEEIGCQIIGGEEESILTTYDKFLLSQMCLVNSLPSLSTFLMSDATSLQGVKFPVIIKPRYGCGSKGIIIVDDQIELNTIKRDILDSLEDYIVQEFVKGQEFGLDIINDFKGDFVAVYVRKKSEMKNGETNIAITESPKAWYNYAQKISAILKHQGTIDVDLIVYENSPYLIDVNYRFGGGYVFNHIAGANTVRAYIHWMKGEIPNESCFYYEAGIKSFKDPKMGIIKSVE
ncbi:ATP-grasp domain-containing protein [Sphingobacterium faecium]|uniref:ATP-grasp domain-containing protein n=1 Tax=Sphingobacterium faecium TaxID=34087 RepID=UPI0024692BEA|nr:ATP-grasp domain-containing protein [Sphingobacterium faecium]MDH5828676.1 ATP-grasp domain-containing protein [Sphingobacterium faecium]